MRNYLILTYVNPDDREYTDAQGNCFSLVGQVRASDATAALERADEAFNLDTRSLRTAIPASQHPRLARQVRRNFYGSYRFAVERDPAERARSLEEAERLREMADQIDDNDAPFAPAAEVAGVRRARERANEFRERADRLERGL